MHAKDLAWVFVKLLIAALTIFPQPEQDVLVGMSICSEWIASIATRFEGMQRSDEIEDALADYE